MSSLFAASARSETISDSANIVHVLVIMDGFLLVGADKSLFSVTSEANSRELLVKNGTVYFAVSEMPRSLVFVTPKGAVTVQQLILNAAADGGLLKGYVAVTGDSAEIGVFEGGSVLVSTVSGETTIQSGKKIILAQNEGQAPEVTESSDDEGGEILIPFLAGGAVAGGAPIGFALATDSDGNGKAASPASP